MNKQILIILLSLFNITISYVADTVEQKEILKNILHENSDCCVFFFRYNSFSNFNNIQELALFSKSIDEIIDGSIDGLVFKWFLADFLFDLLKKSGHTISHSEEAFDYICKLEQKLLHEQLANFIKIYEEMALKKDLEGLTDFCKYLKNLVCFYNKTLKRSNVELKEAYEIFYTQLQCLQAKSELKSFKLKYTNFESIDSEKKFDECKTKIYLINNFCKNHYLYPIQQNSFNKFIKKLAETTHESQMPFHQPFVLDDLSLSFGKPSRKKFSFFKKNPNERT